MMSTGAPLKIVLFGLPRAGKSALLAALAQAQEVHPEFFPGKIEDASAGLANLKKLHYDELPRSTEEETVAYSVRLPSASGPVDTLLVDCNGQVPRELLKQGASFDETPGKLPQAVREANVLILAADVSAKQETVDGVLAALRQFLLRHERLRSGKVEVAGLPVFVVLTKCDLLAEEGDTVADWMRRIEEKKRQVRQQLKDFFTAEAERRSSAFGRLDVQVWATALRRPALGKQPARPREPYGVSELFQQGIAAGRQFREREQRVAARVSNTVQSLVVVLTLFSGLAGLLWSGITRQEVSPLQVRFDHYVASEGRSLSQRLHDYPPDLEARRQELREIRQHEDFETLKPRAQQLVVDRLRELKEYIPYLKAVLKPEFLTLSRSEDILAERETKLRAIQPPRSEWTETGAGQFQQNWLRDVAVLRRSADQVVQNLRTELAEGEKLKKETPKGMNTPQWQAWHAKADAYLARQALPAEDQLRHWLTTTFRELPRNSLVTPRAILRLDRVQSAWEQLRGGNGSSGVADELATLRDVSAILGLVRQRPDLPSLLRFTEDVPASDAQVTANYQRLSRGQLSELAISGLIGLAAASDLLSPLALAAATPPTHRFLNPYAGHEARFLLERIPSEARTGIAQAADNRYQHVRAALLDKIRDRFARLTREEPNLRERWRKLAAWLDSDPEELQAYRRIATVLDRLRRLNGNDPVSELSHFLREPNISTALSSVQVAILFDHGLVVSDATELVIRSGKTDLKLTHLPARNAIDAAKRINRYTFLATSQELVLLPLQPLEISLPVKEDKSSKVLTWRGALAKELAFDWVPASPRLHAPGEDPARGRPLVEGVELLFDPKLPRIPDLLQSLQP